MYRNITMIDDISLHITRNENCKKLTAKKNIYNYLNNYKIELMYNS